MKLGVEGVDWKIFDFIAAGIMLFGAGFAIEIALRLITKFAYRVAACIGILIVLAIVWALLLGAESITASHLPPPQASRAATSISDAPGAQPIMLPSGK